MRIRFLTSTPLDIQRGSGTYVGIQVLARGLQALGHSVAIETPRLRLPVFTAQRLLFNRGLRPSGEFDLTVGFDLDGYRIAGDGHVAALKGVIADELGFERGLTRFTMGIQARRERAHVHAAARVVVTSRYSARRACELYGLSELPAVVPEPLELDAWKRLLADHPASSRRFTVLSVGRFYRRKRIPLLLRAAAQLRARIPQLEVRIVGDGPCNRPWRRLAGELRLEDTVTWLGDVSRPALAGEYNRAHLFCLPSVQEGFGIVLLEAMAAGNAIVAARAAAIPEVAPHALLVEPESAAALAEAILELYLSAAGRARQSQASAEWVRQFDAPLVARRFLAAATGERATGTPA
jgi:glycosyltransferase involved in cell wall biosynthesis